MNTFLFFVDMTYLFGRTVKSLALKKAKSGPIWVFFFFFGGGGGGCVWY